ncbi:hypothetical protein [Bdellovibrio sp.]
MSKPLVTSAGLRMPGNPTTEQEERINSAYLKMVDHVGGKTSFHLILV